MLTVGTDCSGIGAPEQALKNLNIKHEIKFACEVDKFARETYNANHDAGTMFDDMTTRDQEETPDVDLYIAGIPCQSFSIAGRRLGESDARGTLFYNFHEYVQKKQPKYFIIENVKGLLSIDNGTVFQNWLKLLGQSVNTQSTMFPHPDSLSYNLHWTVLNSKDFNVPQNRERVFIVGIRPDLPNDFRFTAGRQTKKRLLDVLESNVCDKYYLSERTIKANLEHRKRHKDRGNGFEFKPTIGDEISKCISTKSGSRQTDNYIIDQKGIRKLTPLECFRLQGYPNDFKKPVSDSQLYKQAGNSITVNVLMAIFKNLLHAE